MLGFSLHLTGKIWMPTLRIDCGLLQSNWLELSASSLDTNWRLKYPTPVKIMEIKNTAFCLEKQSAIQPAMGLAIMPINGRTNWKNKNNFHNIFAYLQISLQLQKHQSQVAQHKQEGREEEGQGPRIQGRSVPLLATICNLLYTSFLVSI